MGKRFNNLEDVYNTLVAIDFDFNSLPTTNKYRKYQQWKQDPEQRKLPDGSAQNQGARVAIGLYPFGLPAVEGNKSLVKMSGRTHALLNGLGGAVYNHLVGDLSTVKPNTALIPAKAILAVKLSNSITVPASDNRITGRSYKKRTGETYTIPFGKGADTDYEFEVQNQIISDRAATHAVTFTPEKLQRV